jgi:hypothetical protein
MRSRTHQASARTRPLHGPSCRRRPDASSRSQRSTGCTTAKTAPPHSPDERHHRSPCFYSESTLPLRDLAGRRRACVAWRSSGALECLEARVITWTSPSGTSDRLLGSHRVQPQSKDDQREPRFVRKNGPEIDDLRPVLRCLTTLANHRLQPLGHLTAARFPSYASVWVTGTSIRA